MWALYTREVKRFQKLLLDTIFSPLVSMILYLAVFGVVTKSATIAGQSYLAFVYAGLIGMIVVNTSFSNPSFALIIAKNLGTMFDLQVAPIPPWAIGLSYVAAAFTRGIATVILALLLSAWWVPGFTIAHPLALLGSVLLTGLEFGLLGVVFGMWARNFEALTFVTTFFLQPMIFLGGVFYPISRLPHPWLTLSLFNPMYHTIALIRYGFLGYADVPAWTSAAVVMVLSAGLFGLMQVVTRRALRIT